MAPQLLFIGLGNMGRGMVKNLVEKGNLENPILIYNRSLKRSQDLQEKLPKGKVEVATSIAEGISKADIIFTCLSNDKAVEDVLSEAWKGDVKGKLFVDSSTIHPDTTTKLAKAAVSHGAEYVAAPVFGAPPAAEAGQLIAVMAGPAESVAKARPYYKGVTARAEVDMSGEPCEKSSLLKILGNTFIFNVVEQLAEGYVLAEKSGLGTENLQKFIEMMFPGPYAGYSARMLSGDYYKREEPLMSVDNARKDAGHAMALGKSVGVRLHNVETADGHLQKAKEYAGEKGDLASIYGAVRQESDLKYENGD